MRRRQLLELTDQAWVPASYRWSIDELRTPGNPLPITYAIGLPPEAAR